MKCTWAMAAIAVAAANCMASENSELLPSTEAKKISLAMQQDERIVTVTVDNQSGHLINAFDFACDQQITFCALLFKPEEYRTKCAMPDVEYQFKDTPIPAGQQRTVRVELEKKHGILIQCRLTEVRGRPGRFLDRFFK